MGFFKTSVKDVEKYIAFNFWVSCPKGIKVLRPYQPIMKQIFPFVLILVFCQATATSQSCLPEGIIFSTQAQIDSFQTDYPGCREIERSVTITGFDITNLNGLSTLTSTGALWIRDNLALTSLMGLDNLTSIKGGLHIDGNAALTSLKGLNGLTSIGGDLTIWKNLALTSLAGLDDVTSIGGYLYICRNESTTSLAGLESLTSIQGNLTISSNTSLTALTGLDNLTFIGRDVEITDNVALTSISGLEKLTSIGSGPAEGGLKIWRNAALTSLAALGNLTSIGGDLWISDNLALTSLMGLSNLTSIKGGLIIRGNGIITTLTGLDNINASSITFLDIRKNSSLSTCEVHSICEYLANPNGVVRIDSNATGCNSKAEVKKACGNRKE